MARATKCVCGGDGDGGIAAAEMEDEDEDDDGGDLREIGLRRNLDSLGGKEGKKGKGGRKVVDNSRAPKPRPRSKKGKNAESSSLKYLGFGGGKDPFFCLSLWRIFFFLPLK